MSKKHLYITIIICLLCVSPSLMAKKKRLPYYDKLEENYLAVWGSAGYSKLHYSTIDTDLFGHAGLAVGGALELHHTPQLFWSFGAELSFMNSGMSINQTLENYRQIEDNDLSDYKDFILHATFRDFSEVQHFGFLTLPVMFGYKPSDFYLLGGVKFGFNLYSDHTSRTTLTTTGKYKEFPDRFHDMPNHGLVTNKKVSDHGDINMGVNFSISGEVGYYISVDKHDRDDIRISAFMDYGIINTNKSKNTNNDLYTGTKNAIDYNFNSILTTPRTTGPALLMYAGFKITYLFCLKSKWVCNCY